MRTVSDRYALNRYPFARPRAEDDREDVVSVNGTVVKNYLQSPTEDVLGPVYPATESTDPWDITDGAVEDV